MPANFAQTVIAEETARRKAEAEAVARRRAETLKRNTELFYEAIQDATGFSLPDDLGDGVLAFALGMNMFFELSIPDGKPYMSGCVVYIPNLLDGKVTETRSIYVDFSHSYDICLDQLKKQLREAVLSIANAQHITLEPEEVVEKTA